MVNKVEYVDLGEVQMTSYSIEDKSTPGNFKRATKNIEAYTEKYISIGQYAVIDGEEVVCVGIPNSLSNLRFFTVINKITE